MSDWIDCDVQESWCQGVSVSPFPIICMLTMALDPGGPLAGSAVFMLGTKRPGPTTWPIIGPAVPPMGPWGPQPCCMEPRIDPLFSISDVGRTERIRVWDSWTLFTWERFYQGLQLRKKWSVLNTDLFMFISPGDNVSAQHNINVSKAERLFFKSHINNTVESCSATCCMCYKH